jgi:hypothetical protein
MNEIVRKPLFIDGAINPHLVSYSSNRFERAEQPSMSKAFESLLQYAKKVFGDTLTYDLGDEYQYRNDKDHFTVLIYQGSFEGSPYMNRRDREQILKAGSNRDWDTGKHEFYVNVTLHSDIAAEVIEASRRYVPSRYLSDTIYTFTGAKNILDSYMKRLNRYIKQNKLGRGQIVDFVDTLELYSGYAKNSKAPMNAVNHIARIVKEGVAGDKAVWMVASRMGSNMTEEFADVPLEWLEKLY